MKTPNEISLILTLALATLLPFVIAAGTCYVKFSIVFSMVRNAIGLQQVPSNMTIQAVALMMAGFVMLPVFQDVAEQAQAQGVDFHSATAIAHFLNDGLGAYKDYLLRYSDPELVDFFKGLHAARAGVAKGEEASIFALMPAYALSEIKSAFEIGFYIFIPFLVVDLVGSNVLLALGMMMMSPLTVSLPIKRILFVAVDGWKMLTEGMILQYMHPR